MTRILTETDKCEGFIMATQGFSGGKARWVDRATRGLTDQELVDALAFELSIFGGSGGPDRLSLTYQRLARSIPLGR